MTNSSTHYTILRYHMVTPKQMLQQFSSHLTTQSDWCYLFLCNTLQFLNVRVTYQTLPLYAKGQALPDLHESAISNSILVLVKVNKKIFVKVVTSVARLILLGACVHMVAYMSCS